ncbi:MFS transporter [Sphingomonas solaris]|uniref:MFS transporter n=1 Tax=Alterirhizorhabdus solaris TaxID=2529389 RepID=UPI0013968F17|nr:MFS transporter [Sphingomonas solaris]
MQNGPDETAVAEWRSNWTTVLVASLGISLSTAHLYSQGLFFAPLEREFGWSRTVITTGPFILSVAAAIGIFFAGRLADRLGPRRVVIPGLLLYGAAVALLTLTSGREWQWYGNWLLIALAFPLVTASVWTAAIVSRFKASRGLALAVALAGTGLSSSLTPLVVEATIENYGWRPAFGIIPFFAVAIVLPLALLLFDRRKSRDPMTDGPAAPKRVPLSAADLRTAVVSPAFLYLLAASMVFAFSVLALMAHFVPFVTGKGLDRASAAAAVSAVGLCSIAGRLTTGFLLDRFSSTAVAAVAFAIPLVALLGLFHYDGSFIHALLIAIVLGASLGAEVDIIAFLTARYLGVRNYSAFLGLVQGCTALAVGSGPFVGSLIYDSTGSYDGLLWTCVPLLVAGVGAILMLGRQPSLALVLDRVPAPTPVVA